jgi:predicted MFS family arabinose efflux permease
VQGAERVGTPARIMLAFLSLSYMLSYFDRLLMAMVGEMVKTEFHLSDRDLSVLNGAAFVVIYGACGVIAGWLADRFNRKRILLVALVAWSLVSMLGAFARTFGQLVLARAAIGVGEASNVPAGFSMIADSFPPERRPMANALFYVGGMIGLLACFTLGAQIAAAYGWRAAFLMAGPPGFVLAALLAFFVREPARTNGRATGEPILGGFLRVWRHPPLRWLLLAAATSTFTNIGMLQWVPSFFLRVHHLTPKQIGLLFGPVIAAGMGVGMLLGGWLGNRIARRGGTPSLIRACAITLVVMIPLYLLMLLSGSLMLALLGAFLGTGASVIYSPAFTAAWQNIVEPQARGTTGGLSSLLNGLIGSALCTYIVGSLSDAFVVYGSDSLRIALSIGTVIFCLAGAGMFFRSECLLRASG